MKYPQLSLDNQLCHRLYLASNRITRAYRPLLTALDLTYPQYVVMMALWEQDHISIASLLTKTGIDPGAMTLILKKVEEKGLIEIQKSETDKRSKFVFLSESGSKLADQAKHIPEQLTCQFDDVDRTAFNQLIALLDTLNTSLAESEEGLACKSRHS
ncbi:MarR family transcriptional regulator [Aestuariibacter sp. AA17]|uniref:MarR family transcriptional regulator n=1 Tax=Fluctibacter corallii TaxID=2984329 RepID=A0ABT3A745_9ALTE|nr:MarR family transcriptional regulator [Aestuariibacter sp. AA17]MCV2884504.1 MarR family transcriptional regulator [Aestuariibacter sp. AA17]